MLLVLPDEILVVVLLALDLDDECVYVALACRRLRDTASDLQHRLHLERAAWYSALPPAALARQRHRTFTRLSSVFQTPMRFIFAKRLARNDTGSTLNTHVDIRTFTRRAAERYISSSSIASDELGAYRLSAVAIDGMLRDAPKNMVLAAFFDVFTMRCGFGLDLTLVHHRALVACACRHGRIEILNRLVPSSDQLVSSSSDLQCGLTGVLFELLYDLLHRGGKFWIKHRETLILLLCPAIRSEQRCVFDWLDVTTSAIERHRVGIARPTPQTGLRAMIALSGLYAMPEARINAMRASCDTLSLIVTHATFYNVTETLDLLLEWFESATTRNRLVLLVFVAMRITFTMAQRHRHGKVARWMSDVLCVRIARHCAEAMSEEFVTSDTTAFPVVQTVGLARTASLVELFELAGYIGGSPVFDDINVNYIAFSSFRLEVCISKLFCCGDSDYVDWLLTNAIDDKGRPTETGFFSDMIDESGGFVHMPMLRWHLDPSRWSMRETLLREVLRSGCSQCLSCFEDPAEATNPAELELRMFERLLHKKHAWMPLYELEGDTLLAASTAYTCRLLIETVVERCDAEYTSPGDLHAIVTRVVEVAPFSFYDEVVSLLRLYEMDVPSPRAERLRAHFGVGIANGAAWVVARRGCVSVETNAVDAIAARWRELVGVWKLDKNARDVLLY